MLLRSADFRLLRSADAAEANRASSPQFQLFEPIFIYLCRGTGRVEERVGARVLGRAGDNNNENNNINSNNNILIIY